MNKKTTKKPSGNLPANRKVRQTHTSRISKRQLFILIGAFLVVIAGIIFTFYYNSADSQYKRMNIVTIDNVGITGSEFLEKARITGTDPMSLLQTITEQEVIKIMAPQYGITVSDADVEAQLRTTAAGSENTISDVEYREWYRQQLNENKMTDKQYKQIIHDSMLQTRLNEYLQERVPTTQEQVHLYWIVTSTLEESQAVQTRLDSGESFTAVAKEVSADTSTKENGGELGWFPVAVTSYADMIGKLEPNQYTTPIAHYPDTSSSSTSSSTQQEPDGFFIFMVSEKDPARQVDDNSLSILKNQALETWFNNEIKNHDIKYNFSSTIYAWLNYQLQKSSTSSTTTTSTATNSGG